MTRVEPFDALGNPTRRAILRQLRSGAMTVEELTRCFTVSRPAVSRHLATLAKAGLVDVREAGASNLYSVRVEGFESVRHFLDEFWDDALDRLQALAREKR